MLIPVFVLALTVGSVMALNAFKPEPEKTSEGPRPISLFVERVQQENLRLKVNTQGEVRPKTEINLVSQVSGRIVWVSPKFVSGGKVLAGDPLIRIEDADYRFAVVRAEARVVAAGTQVELKTAAAEVAKRQWDDRIVGKPTPLAMKLPQLAEARANLKAAEVDLLEAKLNLKRTELSVPFSGRVRSKEADLGQFVTAGLPLGRVYSTKVVEIRLALTDAQLATLALPIGYEAAAGSPGPEVAFTARVAGVQRHWTGRIVRTEAAVDANTRVVYAVAEVESPYGAGADNGMPLAIGLFVEAEIESGQIERALVVPRTALRSEGKVYVISKKNTLDIRLVEVVYSDRDRVVLRTGVKAGERVVVSAVRAPRQGMKVVAVEHALDAQRVASITD